MPDTLNPQVIDTQTALNFKIETDRVIHSAAAAAENGTDSQQRIRALMEDALAQTMIMSRNATMNALAFSQAVTARGVRFAYDISAEQAVGFATTIGAQLQDRILNLGASLDAIQVYLKSAITTPPQTGTGGAFGSDAGNALFQQLANANALLLSIKDSLANQPAPAR